MEYETNTYRLAAAALIATAALARETGTAPMLAPARPRHVPHDEPAPLLPDKEITR